MGTRTLHQRRSNLPAAALTRTVGMHATQPASCSTTPQHSRPGPALPTEQPFLTLPTLAPSPFREHPFTTTPTHPPTHPPPLSPRPSTSLPASPQRGNSILQLVHLAAQVIDVVEQAEVGLLTRRQRVQQLVHVGRACSQGKCQVLRLEQVREWRGGRVSVRAGLGRGVRAGQQSVRAGTTGAACMGTVCTAIMPAQDPHGVWCAHCPPDHAHNHVMLPA